MFAAVTRNVKIDFRKLFTPTAVSTHLNSTHHRTANKTWTVCRHLPGWTAANISIFRFISLIFITNNIFKVFSNKKYQSVGKLCSWKYRIQNVVRRSGIVELIFIIVTRAIHQKNKTPKMSELRRGITGMSTGKKKKIAPVFFSWYYSWSCGPFVPHWRAAHCVWIPKPTEPGLCPKSKVRLPLKFMTRLALIVITRRSGMDYPLPPKPVTELESTG